MVDVAKLSSLTLNQHSKYFEDMSDSFGIEDILVSSQFKDISNPCFANSLSTFWVKTELRNTGNEPKQVYLKHLYRDFEFVYLYVVRQGILNSEPLLAGKGIGPAKRDTFSNNISFLLEIYPNETVTVYRKLKSYVTVNLSAKLYSKQAFEFELLVDLILWAGYFGMIFSLFLYNLLIYFQTKIQRYLPYLFFLCISFIYVAVADGFFDLFCYFEHTNIWRNNTSILAMMLEFSATLFAFYFLEIYKMPMRYRYIFGVLFFIYFGMIFVSIFTDFAPFFKMMDSIILGSIILFLSLAAKRFNEGYKPAKYFIIAWSSFLVFVSSYIATFHGILPLQ